MTSTGEIASMKVAQAGQKRIVIVGATGMVGGYALRYALEDPAVGNVMSIGRRKLGMAHPKLKEVIHPDFADCNALAEALSRQEAAVFCLGAYTRTVSDADLRKITAEYTIEFARVLRSRSPEASFSFLSGSGAVQIPMKAVTDSDLIPVTRSDVMPVTIGAERRWRSYGCPSPKLYWDENN